MTSECRYLPSVRDIVSSRLCAGFKSVHKCPWDDKCKLFLENNPDQSPGEIHSQAANVITSPQGMSKDQSGDPTLKLQ